MKPFRILLCILTSVYFCNTGVKQSLKDSSLHKDSKYIQVYIVPYKNLGVTGAEIHLAWARVNPPIFRILWRTFVKYT